MAKQLPFNITSYDLIKAFAILSMIMDHTGYYFFEDQNWWRVAGRALRAGLVLPDRLRR